MKNKLIKQQAAPQWVADCVSRHGEPAQTENPGDPGPVQPELPADPPPEVPPRRPRPEGPVELPAPDHSPEPAEPMITPPRPTEPPPRSRRGSPTRVTSSSSPHTSRRSALLERTSPMTDTTLSAQRPRRSERHATRLVALLAVLCLALPAWGGGTSVPDAEVTQTIERAFALDDAIPDNDLDVLTQVGTVTLLGETDNILAKERATLIASTVRGVRSVINRIKVQPDADVLSRDVRQDVARALFVDPATDSYEVQVVVDDEGHVRLSGQVQSWQEKELCSTVARGVAGVTAVTNDIGIVFPAQRSDAEIAPEVAARHRWNVLLDGSKIDVAVKDGVVTLSGVVGSLAEKRHAYTDAWILGVRAVDDTLLIVEQSEESGERRSPGMTFRPTEEIESALRDAFTYDPRVKSFNVSVEVVGGWATLRGTVDNLRAKQAAEAVAQNTTGVGGVTNLLKVRESAAQSADVVQARLSAALHGDPWLRGHAFDATVVSGTAFLRGRVVNQFERDRAASVAYGIRGIRRVKNLVEVADGDSVLAGNPHVSRAHPPVLKSYPTWRADRTLKTAITAELHWSTLVAAKDVQVRVANAVATLSGTVGSELERAAAVDCAYRAGSQRVENRIEVAQPAADPEK